MIKYQGKISCHFLATKQGKPNSKPKLVLKPNHKLNTGNFKFSMKKCSVSTHCMCDHRPISDCEPNSGMRLCDNVPSLSLYLNENNVEADYKANNPLNHVTSAVRSSSIIQLRSQPEDSFSAEEETGCPSWQSKMEETDTGIT